jgi:hypothetical protein
LPGDLGDQLEGLFWVLDHEIYREIVDPFQAQVRAFANVAVCCCLRCHLDINIRQQRIQPQGLSALPRSSVDVP